MPVAIALWSSGIGGARAAPLVVRREDARQVEGTLTAADLEPLPLEQLGRKAHDFGLVTGAIVHVFNRQQWNEAQFGIDGVIERLPIDGLSLLHGEGQGKSKTDAATTYLALDRKRVFIPPVQRNNAAVTYQSALGTLVELAVNEACGRVSRLSHHLIMERGNMLSPPLVSVSMQGNSTLREANPHNLIVAMLDGADAADFPGMGSMQAMPGFAATLGDDELAHLANYLRAGWGGQPSDVTAANVKALR